MLLKCNRTTQLPFIKLKSSLRLLDGYDLKIDYLEEAIIKNTDV